MDTADLHRPASQIDDRLIFERLKCCVRLSPYDQQASLEIYSIRRSLPCAEYGLPSAEAWGIARAV